jgi:hypothetical protein
MPELTTSSAYDVKIESVLLTADRFTQRYELAPSIAEINVFENLDLPYLTGSMLLSDTSDLLNKIGFRGTERVSIKVKINGDDTAKSVTKEFIVVDIKVVPTHDMGEMLRLNLLEDFAYRDRMITVSKAYTGKPETIIAKIIKDKLGRDLVVPLDFQGSVVPSMKVLVPNMSPLDAARWVKDRLVSTNGMPFYLYSTLNGPKLFLTDLEYMLAQPTRNTGSPYSYGQAFNRWSAMSNVLVQARNIESYTLPSSENMLKLIDNGTVNSTYDFIDTVKSGDPRSGQVKVDMKEVLDRMVSSGIISRDQTAPIYDQAFTADDTTPSVLSQIASSNSFSNHANYYESDDINLQKLKSVGRAVRHYLFKSPLEISMPGFEFLGRGDNTTIGRQIALSFLKNDPDILTNETEVLDQKRSGKYLVYACRHVIRPEKYSVALSCTKLGDQK